MNLTDEQIASWLAKAAPGSPASRMTVEEYKASAREAEVFQAGVDKVLDAADGLTAPQLLAVLEELEGRLDDRLDEEN